MTASLRRMMSRTLEPSASTSCVRLPVTSTCSDADNVAERCPHSSFLRFTVCQRPSDTLREAKPASSMKAHSTSFTPRRHPARRLLPREQVSPISPWYPGHNVAAIKGLDHGGRQVGCGAVSERRHVARRQVSIASLVVRFQAPHINKRSISMHGTFPERLPKRTRLPEAIDPWTGFGTSFAFALIPLVLATLVAIFRFGSKVTLANIVDVLVAATSATPM